MSNVFRPRVSTGSARVFRAVFPIDTAILVEIFANDVRPNGVKIDTHDSKTWAHLPRMFVCVVDGIFAPCRIWREPSNAKEKGYSDNYVYGITPKGARVRLSFRGRARAEALAEIRAAAERKHAEPCALFMTASIRRAAYRVGRKTESVTVIDLVETKPWPVSDDDLRSAANEAAADMANVSQSQESK